MRRPLALRPALLALSILPLLAACDESGAGNATAAAAAPPAAVSVVTATPEMLPITSELPGRIAPTRIAEVRPRVPGIIVERVFEQGSRVSEGDVLYRIDPEPFRVEVDRARATLERAEASWLQSRQEADRQKALRERNVASGQSYDNAVAALAQAQADVASARAGLAAAELSLHYAEVRAPIGGRIGRALITEGALVDRSVNLATVQQLDPVYADFMQPVSEMLRLRRAARDGAMTGADAEALPVQLLLDDGSPYLHLGRLLFSESTVDATTGQVTLRGEFPNPDGELLPGMYVRVVIQQGLQQNAIAVPQQAVQRDAGGGAQLYVVGPDGTLELRAVTVGRTLGDRWVIERGIAAGEQVVVEGFQKIRPGMAVTAEAWAGDPSAEGSAAHGPAGEIAG